MLRRDDLNMMPMQDMVSCALKQVSPANVDAVMIAGRWVKQEGKLLAADLSQKVNSLRASGERIHAEFSALQR